MKKIQHASLKATREKHIINAAQYYAMNSNNVDCPVAKEFLDWLPQDEYIVDSRVSMLKKGWFPCIPGWHFDEIERRADGTLDLIGTDFDKKHYMMIMDFGTKSRTEFCHYQFTKEFLMTHNINNYDSFNTMIDNMDAPTERVGSNCIYEFTSLDAHRGLPAQDSGWRYFIRATKGHQRTYRNEIRTQTQVYIPFYNINKGW